MLVLLSLVTTIIVGGNLLKPAQADVDTMANDLLRTGWYSDQSNLSPDLVSGGTFGKLFSATVDGQVYAQPLVSQGVLFVATETNNIYGLNPATGAQLWTRNLGTPFNPADVTCSDLAPVVGITATPVIDAATHIAYFTSKSYLSGTSGPAAWYMHAVDVKTGAEQGGFPVRIQGTAANDVTHSFNATKQMQRPGLLLLDGVVYAAFGGHCDRKPYEGWIVGVSTAGRITTLWTTMAGVPQKDPLGPGGGVWMPGGGLISDGPGQIVFSTGNGEVPPAATVGRQPPATLAQSVTRLSVQPDGSLKATDFFAPYDADLLNETDSDLGSGAPVELPSQYFGTPSYPHLLIEVGKQGYVYLLNADNLGGRGEGPDSSDAVVSRIGPSGGIWGKPAVWPGDGGYIYMTTAQGGGGSGKLKAYRYGRDGNGNPTLSLVATSSDIFGFGSSSPVVTSSGVLSGSALVWVVWSPDGTGVGSQLRAYDPVPVNGQLRLRYSAPIGTASKFNSPGVDANRVYVGTRDGQVLGFGAPVVSALSGKPLDLGQVIVGQKATVPLTLTAHTDLTITSLGVDNAVFRPGTPTPALPAALASGQTITIPVTFAPRAIGLAAATLTVTTSIGQFHFGLSGTGESADGLISVAPSPVSFGGVTLGGTPATASTTFSNAGATPIKVNSITSPNAPFSVSGLPAVGSTLAPDASVTVTLSFAPTAVGSYMDTLRVVTSGGEADVPMSGTAGTPGKLTIRPTTIDVGDVSIGANGVATFTVSNTGGSPLTITRSKYPVAGAGFAPYTSLPEGSVIAPGASLSETVLFTPTATGAASDSWAFNSDDGSGIQLVTFKGNGVPLVVNPTPPALYVASQSLIQPTAGTISTNVRVILSAASTATVTVNYATKDATATVSRGDYVATSGTLTFAPGETSKTIPVTINGRAIYGAATGFSVNLSRPVNAVLGTAVGKIRLEPALGLYSISTRNVTVNAAADHTVNATIPVTLASAPSNGDSVTVVVATADGTGRAGVDYISLPPTQVTFHSGETTRSVTVSVAAGAAGVGNKTFVLNLSTPTANASIADAQALVTIVNGGVPPFPSVYVSDVTLLCPTAGTTTANVPITLDTPSTVPITVNYATHDGTALAINNHYLPTSGSITFSPGETSKTVSITIKGDTVGGSDEYFYLNLTHAANAALGDSSGRVTLLNQIGRYIVQALDTSAIQNASAPALAQVTVTLNAPVAAGQTVTVQVSTMDGTAVAGAQNDYTALSPTTLTFAAGQQTVQVPIFVNPNASVSAPKIFSLVLGKTSSNAQVIDVYAQVTIISHS